MKKYITKDISEIEVETQAEIIIDTGLIKMLEKWDKSLAAATKSQEAADQKWIQVAKYVRDHESSREQLFYVLVKIRGMKESNARGEVTRLTRFQKYKEASEMLDRKLDGDDDITIHDLRSARVIRGERRPKEKQLLNEGYSA